MNVISVISPRGRLWFRCFKGNLNAPRFIAFLTDLLHDIRGPIDLVLDRHPAHVAAATRRFIEEHRSRLRVHFLPGYAPEMNPDEHVWAHLKGMFRKEPIEAGEVLDEAVEASMEQIRSSRALVRRFFDHPEVAYVKNALHWQIALSRAGVSKAADLGALVLHHRPEDLATRVDAESEKVLLGRAQAREERERDLHRDPTVLGLSLGARI